MLLDTFNFWYMIHLIAKLANINLLDRNRLQGRAGQCCSSSVRVLRCISLTSERLFG